MYCADECWAELCLREDVEDEGKEKIKSLDLVALQAFHEAFGHDQVGVFCRLQGASCSQNKRSVGLGALARAPADGRLLPLDGV